MSKTDIVVEINYNISEPDKTVIKTNAKPDRVRDILETWLMTQIGQGRDSRNPAEKDKYKISVKLDLGDDTFSVSSDTGNKGLTAGIVISVVGNLDKFKITSLE